MKASEPIGLARDTMLGFDYSFLPQETELLRRLAQEQRKLLEELILLENMALELPGDKQFSVDISTYVASYSVPSDLWRVRQTTVEFSTGPDMAVRRVPSSWRNRVPQYQPAMYLQGSSFFPIDNGSTRTYGWSGAAAVVWDYITEPTDPAAATDLMEVPDEALEYLGAFLAHYMGVRGKVAELTLRELKGHREAAKARLLQLATALPGAQAT